MPGVIQRLNLGCHRQHAGGLDEAARGLNVSRKARIKTLVQQAPGTTREANGPASEWRVRQESFLASRFLPASDWHPCKLDQVPSEPKP